MSFSIFCATQDILRNVSTVIVHKMKISMIESTGLSCLGEILLVCSCTQLIHVFLPKHNVTKDNYSGCSYKVV